MTPLHVASKKGISDVVELLVDVGADLHSKDEVIKVKYIQTISPLN